MGDQPVRVLLVDDHDLIRQGLARAFEQRDDFQVIAQAGTVAEGVQRYDEHRPDVVVTDVRMPDGSGLELVKQIRERGDDAVGLVVLTMYAGDEQLFAALEAGASAFVAKDAPADEVIAAADLAEAMRRKMSPTGPQLTQRETEVLNLLARGFSVAGIAKAIYVSESTAKTHISKIYDKLGAANRADAIMKAVRSGLLAQELD